MNHSSPFRSNRILCILALFAFALPLHAEESAGCQATDRPANGDYSMEFDGLIRNYRLYLPEEFCENIAHGA